MAISSVSHFLSAYGSDGTRYTVQIDASYDDASRVVTFNVVGQATALTIDITLLNGQVQTFDLMPYLNAGQQTVTNVNLRVGAGRTGAGVLTTTVHWTPPS